MGVIVTIPFLNLATLPYMPVAAGDTYSPYSQHTAYRRTKSIIHQRQAPGTYVITSCSSGISISPSHRLPLVFRINTEISRKPLNHRSSQYWLEADNSLGVSKNCHDTSNWVERERIP